MLSIRELAARFNPATIASAKRALKEVGLKQSLATDVMNELDIVKKYRAEKRKARVAMFRLATGRPPVRLPNGTPALRIDEIRKNTIQQEFMNAFRQPAHGSITVELTNNPEAVGVEQVESADWNLYAKSYKHGPARVLNTRITAPEQWRTRVEKLGLATLDGMMTLDAAVLEGTPDGVILYAARWAEQGRGNSVNVSNGVIAISGDHSYHADCAQRALSGLKRKIKSAAWRAEMRTASLDDIVAKVPHVTVKISDARAIGACEYGIRSWCARTGINYEAGEASICEVHAAYLASPAPEARGAIIHAARRARKHIFAAAA